MFRPRPPKPRDKRRHPDVSFQAMWPPIHGPVLKGKGLCRCGCGQPIAGKQRAWATRACSARALRAYLIAKGNSREIRRALKELDHGVCCDCGLNTCEALAACREWISREDFADQASYQAAQAETAALRARYMALGFPPPGGTDSWWEADHDVPLEEGGANAMENLRTRCVRCHRRRTRAHAARRARRRKGMA